VAGRVRVHAEFASVTSDALENGTKGARKEHQSTPKFRAGIENWLQPFSASQSTVQFARAQVNFPLGARIATLGTEKRSGSRLEVPVELKARLGLLPTGLSQRITELVMKALSLNIELTRVLQYASLATMIDGDAQVDAISKDHTARSWHELAGVIHGPETGYWDEQEAGTRYRRGRRARQLLGVSLDGVITKWRKFQQLVDRRRVDLPVHNQQQLSAESLEAVGKTLVSLRISLFLEHDVLRKEHRRPRLPARAKTYSAWRFLVPRYRGKWSDMHRLAVAWGLSVAEDVETFRSIVMRVPPPSQDILRSLTSAWQSLFGKL